MIISSGNGQPDVLSVCPATHWTSCDTCQLLNLSSNYLHIFVILHIGLL